MPKIVIIIGVLPIGFIAGWRRRIFKVDPSVIKIIIYTCVCFNKYIHESHFVWISKIHAGILCCRLRRRRRRAAVFIEPAGNKRRNAKTGENEQCGFDGPFHDALLGKSEDLTRVFGVRDAGSSMIFFS
jgi:hypothetical protein